MAYTTIKPSDAEKYPAMKGKVGKTVTASEFRSLQRNSAAAATPAAPAKTAAKAPAKKAAAKKATAKKATPKKK